jgi:hypothetical protein
MQVLEIEALFFEFSKATCRLFVACVLQSADNQASGSEF